MTEMYNSVCLTVHFRFKHLLTVETKASISLDLTNQYRWNFIFEVITTNFKVVFEKLWRQMILMTSYEIKVTILRVMQKQALIFTDFYQTYLNFRTGRCLIVFGENQTSLSLQNGGPKFAKLAHLCKISHFCSYLKTKCFCFLSTWPSDSKNI